jgi:hypothetical protein
VVKFEPVLLAWLDYCTVAYTIMTQQNTHYVYSSYSGSSESHILFKASSRRRRRRRIKRRRRRKRRSLL